MTFIFPKNYTFKSKLLGLFDYSTAIFNLLFFILVFILSNLIFSNIKIKIFIIISLYFPVFLFSIVGFNHENILYILMCIIKFIFKRKFYLYNKF